MRGQFFWTTEMVSMETVQRVLVTVLRLGKWTLFVLVALSYLLLNVEYDDQADNNHGFKVDLPLPERANAMNSRVAFHSSTPSKVVPAALDKNGAAITELESAATKRPHVGYYRDPRIGINPFAVLPSTLVGLRNDAMTQMLPYEMRDSPIKDINTAQGHTEVPVGGTLKLNCDGDYLLSDDDELELNKFLAATGKSLPVTEFTETDFGGNVCDRKGACQSNTMVKSLLAEYVSPDDNVVKPEIFEMFNFECENIFLPGKDKLKNKVIAAQSVNAWNNICHDSAMMFRPSASLDVDATAKAISGFEYQVFSICDILNSPIKTMTEAEKQLKDLVAPPTDSSHGSGSGSATTKASQVPEPNNQHDFCKILSDTEHLRPQGYIFFNQIMNTIQLDEKYYDGIHVVNSNVPISDTITSFSKSMQKCTDLSCPFKQSNVVSCTTSNLYDACMGAFDYFNEEKINLGDTFIAGNKKNLWAGEFQKEMMAIRARMETDLYQMELAKNASGEKNDLSDNEIGTVVKSAFTEEAKKIKTNALSQAPIVTEETQEICHEYQNGQQAALALLYTGLILMGLGLVFIVGSLFENVWGTLWEQGIGAATKAYQGKALSGAARAANFCGYMFIIIAALVNRHYNGKGDAITVYMSTVIFGDMNTLNTDTYGAKDGGISAADVIPNQPISFGIEDGYVKHQMGDELDEADPSYPYDRHTANIMFYIAVAMFTIDFVASMFWDKIKDFFGGDDKGNMRGELGETTMMSRLMTSIL